MSNPKILVTTAASKTGFATVIQILEAGYPVHAFVRRCNAHAAYLEKAGAEKRSLNLIKKYLTLKTIATKFLR